MDENITKRNWLRIFSPAILGIFISFIGIVESAIKMESSGGWSFLGFIALLPVIAILLGVDFIVKHIFKNNVLLIWIVEIVALGLVYFLWLSKFS